MKGQIKQVIGLSAFAAVCMALGMGLSYHWMARAQEEGPVAVDAKGADRLPPIAEVAEKLNPTVVSITNTSYVKSRRSGDFSDGSPFGDDFFNWFFGPQRPRQQRPRNDDDVERVTGAGSGVVISSEGEILTNYHVVEGYRGGEATLEVRMADGKTYKAKVLGKDKDIDIALIKVDLGHLPYAKLGDSDSAKVGEWVVAIGNPLGLDHTVTQGIISAKGRSSRVMGGGSGLESFLQTDAAINRGNSGGPLLNLRGEIIGINTAINPAGQNIGFAVPINMVKRILGDLRSGRPVSRGYLGITLAELDGDFQASLGVREGVVVGDVQRGQPADRAGVRRLDVICFVDGQKVRNPDDLIASIAGRRSGESVKLRIVRDGKEREISVVLGDRKNAKLEAGSGEEEEGSGAQGKSEESSQMNLEKMYGFSVEALTAANRHTFGIAEDRKGVVVTYVSPKSPAAEKLQAGLVISAVGTREVDSFQAFQGEVRKAKGKRLLLLVRSPRGGGQTTVAVAPR